jgi:hypothetical protein
MATTRNELGVYAGFPEETACETVSCPPAFLEYTWYGVLAYAMLGQAWGVVIPVVGGAMFAVLAAACLLSTAAQVFRVYAPVALALCTGVSVIAVQYFFHSELSLSQTWSFIGWLCNVIIAPALALRPRFLQRFALAASAIGLGVVPFVQVSSGSGYIRAGAAGTIGSANALGMWFGFCTVYFMFWGLQFHNLIHRFLSWAAALGCLFMVLLALSRGPMLGIFLACVVGFWPAARRNFFSVTLLIFLMGLVYISGLFQQNIEGFFIRGMEETGRGLVWPVALQRILDSPWTGIGMENVVLHVGWHRYTSPHNALLYIALGSGIVPLMCFLGYLALVVKGVLHIMRRVSFGEAALLPALVTYALVEVMTLDTAFMHSWTVVVLGLAATAQDSARSQSR